MINKIQINSTGDVFDIEHMRVESTKTVEELQAELNALGVKKGELISTINTLKTNMNALMGDYTRYLDSEVTAIIADDITVQLGNPITIEYTLEPRYVKDPTVSFYTDNDNIIISNDGSIGAITSVGEYTITLSANNGNVTKTIKITVTE